MDTSRNYNQLIEDVEAAIESDQLILPSAPDTLVRARQLLNDANATTEQLASLIATDTALAARILKVANSVIYKTHNGIDNLQQAISRLGNKLIQTLITSHAMMQLFAQKSGSTNDLVTRQLDAVQTRSIEIARLSYAIAQHSGQLSADDALLAGLVHDIGYLPLLQVLDKSSLLNKNDNSIIRFLKTNHPKMGAKILQKWKFPYSFIEVAKEHEKIDRKGDGTAALVDVVIIANLYIYEKNKPEKDISITKATVSAFIRLGVNMNYANVDFNSHMETAHQLLPS